MCPHGGSLCPGVELPAAPAARFPITRHPSSLRSSSRSPQGQRDLLRNPGQEAPLDACPSGLEQTLERSSLLGFKVFPTVKNSQQPPLNPSAGKTSLFLLWPRFQPSRSPPTLPCRAMGLWPVGAESTPCSQPGSSLSSFPPLPFGFNFSPGSRCPNGAPGAPHQAATNRGGKHPSRRPGLARSLCTPSRAATSSPAGCPFYGDLQKKPKNPQQKTQPQFLASGGRCRQALRQRGRLGFGASRQFLASPGVGRRWDVWRREQGQHLVFSNKGIKRLKP